MLETYIKDRLKKKDILLMTHIVIGYPDFETSRQIVQEMVSAGVDLMELQIPFSEPMADGPVILRANQKVLENKVTVKECMEFAAEMTQKFEIPFLFMSYYNILFQYGLSDFADVMKRDGLVGAIVPDLPPEEGEDYLDAMTANERHPIQIFSPNTSDERMKYLASNGSGFIYCVARKGVTGNETRFSTDLDDYLKRCRQATDLPLAVGFGVKEKSDIEYLKGKADIAVIGSETIRVVDQQGVSAVGGFITGLIT